MMNRRLAWPIAVLTMFFGATGCDLLTTADEPDYDFGDCIAVEPSSGMIGDVSLSLEVVPGVVGYGDSYSRQVKIQSLGPEVDYSVGCVARTWLRGERSVHDPICSIASLRLLPDSETVIGQQGRFRSSGSQFATPGVPGIRAEPGAFCFVVEFVVAGDTLRLESPLELVGS